MKEAGSSGSHGRLLVQKLILVAQAVSQGCSTNDNNIGLTQNDNNYYMTYNTASLSEQ